METHLVTKKRSSGLSASRTGHRATEFAPALSSLHRGLPKQPSSETRRRKNPPKSPEELDHGSSTGVGPASESRLSGLLNSAIEIAAKRRILLGTIRAALERQDHPEVLRLVRRLCGANDEKGCGADPSID